MLMKLWQKSCLFPILCNVDSRELQETFQMLHLFFVLSCFKVLPSVDSRAPHVLCHVWRSLCVEVVESQQIEIAGVGDMTVDSGLQMFGGISCKRKQSFPRGKGGTNDATSRN